MKRHPSMREFYRQGNTIAQMGEEKMLPVGTPIYLTPDSGPSKSAGEATITQPIYQAVMPQNEFDMNDVIKQFTEQSMVDDTGSTMTATRSLVEEASASIPPVTINKQPIPGWAVLLGVLLLLRR